MDDLGVAMPLLCSTMGNHMGFPSCNVGKGRTFFPPPVGTCVKGGLFCFVFVGVSVAQIYEKHWMLTSARAGDLDWGLLMLLLGLKHKVSWIKGLVCLLRLLQAPCLGLGSNFNLMVT